MERTVSRRKRARQHVDVARQLTLWSRPAAQDEPVSRFTQELSQVCRERLLEEKWLIAPSRRVGFQWLEAVTRGGQAAVNVHVETLRRLALELAGPDMAARKAALIPTAGGPLIVDMIWSRGRGACGGYLGRLTPSFELSRTIHASIQSLRLAGLGPDSIDTQGFEDPDKGRELVHVMRKYLDELRSRNWLDWAGVLEMALERLRREPAALSGDVLVLVPADVEATGLERDLLGAIPAAQRLTLATEHDERASESLTDDPALAGIQTHSPLTTPTLRMDQPVASAETSPAPTDLSLLRWFQQPAAAPAPKGDGTAEVFQAVGAVNEVREVLRRVLAAGWRLDEVELLHADAATYVPLIYETAAHLQQRDGPLCDGVPVTFAEGVPVRYSRPGRALAAWLAWRRDDYPQAALARMIQDGLLHLPAADTEPMGFTRLAATLRSLGIGFGRDRYLPALDRQLAALREQISAPAADDDTGEVDPGRLDSLRRRLDAVETLRGLVTKLFDASLPTTARPTDTLRAAAQFVETLARAAGEFDNLARQRVLQVIREMAELIDAAGEPGGTGGLNVYEWLDSLPHEIRVGGTGPRAGCLHVAHVMSGGHSGRKHTFIVGLDEGRFPGAGLQDPLLLDSERTKLSPHLATAAVVLHRRLDGFARLLARLRGTVTLSYPCRNLVDDRELFPSPSLLAVWRILSGQRAGDLAAMHDALTPAASFAPDRPERCLSDADWWLWRLCRPDGVRDGGLVVGRRFPHLGRGDAAARHRRSAEFTVYDGWVDLPGPELNPAGDAGPHMSSRRFETLGRCPLAYFFQYVLKLKVPDELTINPDQWLQPLQSGELLHGVFECFMRELMERGELPEFARDESRLQAVLDQQIARYRDRYPPPSDGVFRREVKQLGQTARMFLREEEIHCQTSRPQFLEASVGLRPREPQTPIDSPEPVPLRLPDGRRIQVVGRVDRIDRIADTPPTFTIWDYKTGSSRLFTGSDPFRKGRNVQHVLYLEIVRARLHDKISRHATVDYFGYFFPGGRGRGDRRRFAPEALAGGHDVLARLTDIAANGAFLATNTVDDCKYCDYRAICGDVAAVTSASQQKLGVEANEQLQPFRELRKNGANGGRNATD